MLPHPSPLCPRKAVRVFLNASFQRTTPPRRAHRLVVPSLKRRRRRYALEDIALHFRFANFIFYFFQKGSVSGLKVHSGPSSAKAKYLVYAATAPDFFAPSIAVRADTQVGPAFAASHGVNDSSDLNLLAIMAPSLRSASDSSQEDSWSTSALLAASITQPSLCPFIAILVLSCTIFTFRCN